MLVRIGPDRPEQKNVSTCGGNDNNVGTRGCFHKADLHSVVEQINISYNKTLRTEPEVTQFIIGEFCHSA